MVLHRPRVCARRDRTWDRTV